MWFLCGGEGLMPSTERTNEFNSAHHEQSSIIYVEHPSCMRSVYHRWGGRSEFREKWRDSAFFHGVIGEAVRLRYPVFRRLQAPRHRSHCPDSTRVGREKSIDRTS